jgi:hypothetical protein
MQFTFCTSELAPDRGRVQAKCALAKQLYTKGQSCDRVYIDTVSEQLKVPTIDGKVVHRTYTGYMLAHLLRKAHPGLGGLGMNAVGRREPSSTRVEFSLL